MLDREDIEYIFQELKDETGYQIYISPDAHHIRLPSEYEIINYKKIEPYLSEIVSRLSDHYDVEIRLQRGFKVGKKISWLGWTIKFINEIPLELDICVGPNGCKYPEVSLIHIEINTKEKIPIGRFQRMKNFLNFTK
jgi:hypothetical protein